MAIVLSASGASLSPIALTDYTADQEGGSILHDVLGKREPDVTLRPVGLLMGSMSFHFPTDALAMAARASLSGAAVWTLTHTDRSIVNMRFIVRRLSPVVDTDGRHMLTVGFEEVS